MSSSGGGPVLGRILVAGIGNVFLGDDGFGVEVVRRRRVRPAPEGVDVADIGIRGVHLAFQLLDGYDVAILVDAMPHGEAPGTVSVVQHEQERGPEPPDLAASPTRADAHGMTPDVVLGLLAELGGAVPLVLVIGCEPEGCEPGLGLSPVVTAATEPAVDLVLSLVERLRAGALVAETAR